jgi:hypothetical protein
MCSFSARGCSGTTSVGLVIHGRKIQRISRGALSRCKAGLEMERTSRVRARPDDPTPPGWARLDSNQGPRPYQGRALTT